MKRLLAIFFIIFFYSFRVFAQCDADHTVILNNFEFVPSELVIVPGESVAFINIEGIHNLNGQIETLPPTEIITSNDFFDFEAKYEGKSEEITPAQIPESMTQAVQIAAKEIYTLLDLTGVARADFILHDNQPYLIEINTVPGLSQESIIPQQAIAKGYTLPQFFDLWVKASLK